mmetsp:Transcript_38720/g.111288  ORF Transcript_38720/g.111288 Transcript_38720/m.111288 type:complete len:424 (-) Transcript_38720:336-1607(-)
MREGEAEASHDALEVDGRELLGPGGHEATADLVENRLGAGAPKAMQVLHNVAAVPAGGDVQQRVRRSSAKQPGGNRPLALVTRVGQRRLRHMAGGPVHRQLRDRRQQALQDFSAAMARAVLDEVLDDEVAILVPAQRLRALHEAVVQSAHLLLSAVLDQALQHTATELMPRNGEAALLLDALHDGPQRGAGHDLDELRQDMIPVRRLVQLHRPRTQALSQLVAPRGARDLEQALDHTATALRQGELVSAGAYPVQDALVVRAAGREPGERLVAHVRAVEQRNSSPQAGHRNVQGPSAVVLQGCRFLRPDALGRRGLLAGTATAVRNHHEVILCTVALSLAHCTGCWEPGSAQRREVLITKHRRYRAVAVFSVTRCTMWPLARELVVAAGATSPPTGVAAARRGHIVTLELKIERLLPSGAPLL